MDIIYECANNFSRLLSTKYNFVISQNRNIKKLTLDFDEKDFRHAVGLHYVDDIVIEKNPSKVIKAILNHQITDEMLDKSDKYKKEKRDSGSIKERVDEMRFLEQYLDNSDFIRIYQMQKFGSVINADYFIEAINQTRHSTVYIFIRKREENDNYVVVSFFKKYSVFIGNSTYWMLKEKIIGNQQILLYKHPGYNVAKSNK